MALKNVPYIWMNGKLVKWDEAKIHVLSHVIHYGSSWFEGIRCYDTKKGPAIFRLDAHLRRLYDSTKIYRADVPYSKLDLEQAIKETIKANSLKACYIRPIVYRGYGEVGVNPLGCPVDVTIAVWEWGAYLGAEALERGIDACVSSWRRAAPDTFPTIAKSSGNYLNSQLIKLEAIAGGYIEGIALDAFGLVSEGSGENIFLVREKTVFTPPISAAILPGVTRSSIITLARELGYNVVEMNIPREMLFTVEEVFFTGTAAEITPVRSIDRIPVGEGKPGPVTKDLQTAFFDVVRNGVDKYHWLNFIT
ncbi:MAG TPA: branched chain amino acid aminotransferase [Bacteroidetes bacterium]|nr:branched chain amino acid aminotransferase [Bacteroidota bacterium]